MLEQEIARSSEPVELEIVYQDEYFVDVLPAGSHADTRNVRGSNRCQIAIHQPQGGHTVGSEEHTSELQSH